MRRCQALLFFGVWWSWPAKAAWAGMPSVTFSELARMRLEAISFFLVVALVSALAVMLLWNYVSRDVPRLPRLSYAKACGIVALWGLLFLIVLTMISGARELMTPGAWEKKGLTYQLRDRPESSSDSKAASHADGESPPSADLASRHGKLNQLAEALSRYAKQHGGRYPEDRHAGDIPDQLWQLPTVAQVEYIYIAGQSTEGPEAPLAFEPDLFSGEPLVLLTTGEIVRMSREQIKSKLEQRETP